ncbi:chaperonin CPN60-like 2, mitochondrial isoform X6 [Arachis hypogaea]|uniref:chaperonin CPN60-like 2, mitochondrial isoform X6 n=1 Tax=Arachis hypogaea TaxID=3818 RepID=UPI003B20F2C8
MYRLASKLASSITSSTSWSVIHCVVISSRNYTSKDINFGVGARATILQSVTKVANAVKVTMGPKDKAKNIGADLVKQVAKATNTAVGDGTTCATVLSQAILTEGCKSIAAGVNVMDLRNGINKAVDAVITDLKSRAVMISTPEEITQIFVPNINYLTVRTKVCLILYKLRSMV